MLVALKVAKNISAAGCKTNFYTVLGNDDFKKFVLDDLKKSK